MAEEKEIPKTIFIFKGRRDAAKHAEAFLRNREWTVESAIDVREGVADLLRMRPSFVLLFFDPSNPNARAIPRLLQQATSARIILYFEGPAAASTGAQDFSWPYMLFPPISGPAIERMAWRAQRDEQKRLEHELLASAPLADKIQVSQHAQDELLEYARVGHLSVGGEAVPAEGGEPARAKVVGGKAPFDGNDSILVAGAERALQVVARPQTSTARPAVKAQEIKTVSHLGCIDVKTPTSHGYLLIAWSADRALDADLLRGIRQAVTEFTRERGEDFEIGADLRLRLREVSFEAWAMEQAKFVRRATYEGQDIGVAFFPESAPEIKFEPSARPDMVQIEIEDLQGDGRVEFDVYLHLPANDKFLLYTPEGARFFQKQKDRLREHGVQKMHLKKEAAVDLRRYKIQNFLNERIAECLANKGAA